MTLLTLALALLTLVPTGPRTAVPPDYRCLPLVHGFAVWPGSPECPRYSSLLSVPTPERLGAIRSFTVRRIDADLRSGALTSPVPDAELATILVDASRLDPVFQDREVYGTYATPPGWADNCGPGCWAGCAWGVGSWPPQIDASRPPGHVERLVSWEITNATLSRLDRPDLWDGPYVSAVVTSVGQQLGGWAE